MGKRADGRMFHLISLSLFIDPDCNGEVVRLPPLRLPLGTDAFSFVEGKNAFVQQELDTWGALSSSTNF
ncbi:hypothetical protein D3879_12540 [Pseudomonas cavernicola]|uniref:Uncharacterized protein n=1 Tax=Pseudomonas cavernicola TaxID=2320866 RepID=A0A418XNG9_9PSED|nr:hypothetical protein [Pseudomonas cavernicola]RJG14001.1 hypothetical protein D3879_12540 [Pseudomonas cavernicola]